MGTTNTAHGTAGKFTKGTLRGMARRVVAVRAELSEVNRRGDAVGRTMAKALGRDLLVLESRLADAMAVAS